VTYPPPTPKHALYRCLKTKKVPSGKTRRLKHVCQVQGGRDHLTRAVESHEMHTFDYKLRSKSLAGYKAYTR
jgi:hypothetical protein